MSDTVLSREEFHQLTRPLIGLTVSRPWKGYGSAVFFELGELTPSGQPHRSHLAGAASIRVEWDWRVEAATTVLYGSSNGRPEIAAGIAALQGTTVQAMTVDGDIPELVIQFSNGHCLRTMVMVTGDPEWRIKLAEDRYVYAQLGELYIGAGAEATLTAAQRGAFARAQQTVTRWGTPTTAPRQGNCIDCASYVPLDGDGPLLDYGCCTAELSPFDGKVVARSSGCAVFSSEQRSAINS